MNRRDFLIVGVAAMLPLGAHAQMRLEDILEELRLQGYDVITVGRTWLRRTRVIAEGPGMRREIVLNPSTGEVLRDYVEFDEAEGAEQDDSGRGRGRGRGGDDDDRDDDGGDAGDGSGGDD